MGWQHTPMPDPPDGVGASTREAWAAWFGSWFAANWGPEDLPGLIVTAQLYHLVQAYMDDPYVEKETRKGDTIYVLRPNPASELRQMMDNYGITPKGQQDRRWVRPKEEDVPEVATPETSPYAGLRVVGQ